MTARRLASRAAKLAMYLVVFGFLGYQLWRVRHGLLSSVRTRISSTSISSVSARDGRQPRYASLLTSWPRNGIAACGGRYGRYDGLPGPHATGTSSRRPLQASAAGVAPGLLPASIS